MQKLKNKIGDSRESKGVLTTTKIEGNKGNALQDIASPKLKDTQKVEKIFKTEITNSSNVEEREVFIKFYMQEKKVSREVAAAEYDFFI